MQKWVAREVRDQVVDFVHAWVTKGPVSQGQLLKWIGISSSKYHDWERRYGQANQHNASLPRNLWIAEWEKEAIVKYYDQHPQEGYRRLSYMMLNA